MIATRERPATERLNPRRVVQVTLVAAALMPMLGGATIAPALPQIRDAFAGAPNASLLTGMVLSTHALAIMLLAPAAGWIGDYVGRKPTMLLGLAGFALAGTSGAWLPNLPSILVGRLLLGASIALPMTSVTGLVGDLFDEQARRKLLSRQQAAGAGGGLLFMLGAGALATLGWREAFLMYFVGAVLILPALLFVPSLHRTDTAPDESTPSNSRLGRWLVAPVVAMFAIQMLFYVIPTQVPGLLAEDFDASPFQTSVALSFMTLTMLPVSLLYPRLSRYATPPGLMVAAFAIPTVGFAVLAMAQSMVGVVAGLMITATGMALAGPSLSNWVISHADDTVRGRAVGILTTGLFAGQFFSPVLTQPIIDMTGLRPTLMGVAAASALITFGFTALARRGAQVRKHIAYQSRRRELS